ncbi:unnamed protein product, partial [Rotaria magnacalcarata]
DSLYPLLSHHQNQARLISPSRYSSNNNQQHHNLRQSSSSSSANNRPNSSYETGYN